jgi:hypothetical protein
MKRSTVYVQYRFTARRTVFLIIKSRGLFLLWKVGSYEDVMSQVSNTGLLRRGSKLRRLPSQESHDQLEEA